VAHHPFVRPDQSPGGTGERPVPSGSASADRAELGQVGSRGCCSLLPGLLPDGNSGKSEAEVVGPERRLAPVAPRRQAAEAEKARRVRLKALKQRGASVWREIEDRIERRNPAGYDQAMSVLSDLQALAVEEGSQDDFNSRVGSIRARHDKKGKFIERLNKLGRASDEGTA